ncbi:MAG: S-methyl-5-thioribose-1-phosphate isomerase [Thermoplasmata archaeon]
MRATVNGQKVDIPAVWWDNGRIAAIDQSSLPDEVKIVRYEDYRDIATAIRTMSIRGAPTIGAAAAYGIALAATKKEDVSKAAETLRATRPTAHDLFYAINWMLGHLDDPVRASMEYANNLIDRCRKIGEHGEPLILNNSNILTHCNAGALATVDFGTALAPMRIAKRNGKRFFVYVDETRPRLQGAALTSWELMEEEIEHAIIADNAAGYYMKKDIDLVIIGADRIARNGDTANKIGSYEKAVVAYENGVPFYVAAPASTFDFSIKDEREIPIEQRDESEVLQLGKMRIAPKGARALNPAFDVTPAKYITGFITEIGILKPNQIGKLAR